jgi:hypothetical protein
VKEADAGTTHALGRGVRAGADLRKEKSIMATNEKGKGQVAALAGQLIAGVAKYLTSTTSVVLEGSSYTAAQITSKLQSIVTLRSDVDTAKASTKAKLAAEASQLPALRGFMTAFESYVRGAYGSQPDALADFGLQPRKVRAPATIEAKAAAVAKRASTRAARNTMGKVQKKAVKGDVTGVVVTPVTSAPTSTVATPGGPTAPATSGSGQAATPAPAGSTTSGTTPVTTTTHST